MKFERYGIGIAKGMALTFKHLFRHPITIQYPEEKIIVSRRIRGNEMVWFPDKCTGCATCAKSCPHGNIDIVTHKDESNNYIVDKFEVDAGRCMFCGLCIEACPYLALAFGMSYEEANYRRGDLVSNKEDLVQSDTRIPSGYDRPLIEATLPKQQLLINWDKEDGQKLGFMPRSKKKGWSDV